MLFLNLNITLLYRLVSIFFFFPLSFPFVPRRSVKYYWSVLNRYVGPGPGVNVISYITYGMYGGLTHYLAWRLDCRYVEVYYIPYHRRYDVLS